MLAPWRFLCSRWPWSGLLYTVLSALLTLVIVPLLVITLLLLPLWGILVAVIDRRRLGLLGVRPPRSGHVRVPADERRNWLGIRLTEPATWREALSMLAGIVFGAIAVVVVATQAVCVLICTGIAIDASHREVDVNLFGDVHLVLGPHDWWQLYLLVPPVLVVFAYLNAALAAAQGACVRWLIAPRAAEIDRRVAQLTRSRAAIVAAHEAERRRIERDLHDGVQQELVVVAARLGMLELELAAGDPAAAHAALRAAQEQTESALATLRETARGIHPAVLGDRGLAAAVEDLAVRSVIRIRVADNGFPRLSAPVEAAGYFVVAEASSNAVKHTAATLITIDLDAHDGQAVVTVTDNGHGGADPARGTGLRGLVDRAEALGGSLSVTSPAGGPTVLRFAVPVATAEAASGQPGGDAADADSARR